MPTPFNSKYSSTEIENFFDLLNSNSFITNTVSNLVNYYLKSDTYSKSEVDSIINTVKNGRFQNVNSLPEQDIDTNVIYLVQKQNTENNNIKDEYINLDGTSAGWEKIGSTEINLDGYVTIQALNTALSNYVQASNIVTILANRTSFSSIENMVAIPAADLYDGCLAYVTATKKNYQYDSTNETDPTLGKWRELQTGGGGGTDYTAGDGISIDNDEISIDPMPAEDMDDVIDELPTGGNMAVAGYVPLGTLIPFYGETAPKFFLACDGSTYNKADYPELAKHLLSLTNNTPYIVDGDDTKFKVPDLRGEFIRGTGSNSHTNQGSGENVGVHQDGTEHVDFGFDQNANSNIYVNSNKITIGNTLSSIKTDTQLRDATKTGGSWFTRGGTYTANGIYGYTSRPTNTSVLFCIAYKDIYSNPMNDYSTDEKVVGTWIDGKPIYQRTFVNVANAQCQTDGTLVYKYVDIGALVDTVVDLKAVRKNPSSGTGSTVNPIWMNMNNDYQQILYYNNNASSDKNTIRIGNNKINLNSVVFNFTIQYTKA